jgi:hypothetical protein
MVSSEPQTTHFQTPNKIKHETREMFNSSYMGQIFIHHFHDFPQHIVSLQEAE